VSVTVGGKVVAKAVAGCNGFKARHLAESVRSAADADPQAVYWMARQAGFGCEDCLVVQGPAGAAVGIDIDGEEYDRYRRTFDDPRFNPRWEYGTAEYVEVVELDDD
jgi:hypothetical protein